MAIFVPALISGLATGSTYALIVLGMTLLVLARKIVHFGFAYIVVLTMYFGWLVLQATYNNLFIALPAFIVIGVVFTLATEPLFRPLAKKGAFLESLVLGQGIAIFLTDVFSHFFNHGYTVAFPANMAGGGFGIRFGLTYFTLGNIYALVLGIIAVFILLAFLYRSREGRAVRAIAQDQSVARKFGISFTSTGVIGFAVAGVLAGIVAIAIAMVLKSVNAGLGDTLAVKAMILMLFAGMGNLTGGLVCALILGVIEALTQAYLPGAWTDAVTYGALMLIILVRPNGLFGARA